MSGPSKTIASDPVVADVAEASLAEGGSAVDAVLGGFLAAAALEPGVLFGPVGALVAGLGAGARVFDGRTLQAGRGAKRPRGLRPGDTIPPAARAAVPRSLGVLPLLHAYGATKTLAALGRLGRTRAKKEAKSDPTLEARLRFLEAFARRGPGVIASSDIMRPLVQRAGPVAGGLLTEEDLADARPADEAATFQPFQGETELTAMPWSPPASGRPARIVVAADVSGIVAALAYVPDPDGVDVPELGLKLTRDGEPIRRGVPRVTPGEIRPAALPIGVLRRADGWHAALGVTTAGRIEGPAAQGAATVGAWLSHWLSPGAVGFGATTHKRRVSVTRVD